MNRIISLNLFFKANFASIKQKSEENDIKSVLNHGTKTFPHFIKKEDPLFGIKIFFNFPIIILLFPQETCYKEVKSEYDLPETIMHDTKLLWKGLYDNILNRVCQNCGEFSIALTV